jgi:hypothetical protein
VRLVATPSAAITAARERRDTGALELYVVALPVAANDFAEQDRAPIAETRIPAAELMAGINCRDRVGAFRQVVAGNRVHALGGFQPGRIDAEQASEFVVDADQCGIGDRHRRLAPVKALRQVNVGIVELWRHAALRCDSELKSTRWGHRCRITSPEPGLQ